MKHKLNGWRAGAMRLSLVPVLLLCGLALMAVIPALALAGCFLLPWLPVYKSSGFGISLGEGDDE